MDPRAQFHWQDLVEALLRRKGLILLVFVSGAATAAALAALEPPTYVATAKLMLSPERADVLVSPDANARPAVRSSNDDVATEVALLRSADLVREVLEPHRRERRSEPADPSSFERITSHFARLPKLPLELYRKLHGVAPTNGFDAWVLSATERLIVMPIGRSNLLSVSYRDSDPAWAAEFVNQVVSRHVERRIRFNRQLNARGFYESQQELLSQRVREAEVALQHFTEQLGTQALPSQREIIRGRLSELETGIAAADAELAEASARVAFLSKLRAETRAEADAGSPEAANKDPKQLLQTRVLELELDRSQLLATYAPTGIKIRDIDRRIAEARRLLAETGGDGGGGVLTGSTRATIEADLAQARTQIAAVTARKQTLRDRIAPYQEKLRQLDQSTPEYDRLAREVKTATQSFMTYVKKEEEARFSEALDESKIVNVIVAEAAQVPTVSQPSRGPLVFGLGAAMSFLAGILLAFVRDRLDPLVKSAREAQRLTELPILADIPS